MLEVRLCLIGIFLHFCSAEKFNEYNDKDKVELFVNKVGPYNNPDETYHFYTLPLCQPDEVKHKSMSLGEILKGDRLAYSHYSLKFKDNLEGTTLCKRDLSTEQVNKLISAIEEEYYFEFYFDDLPLRGFIGEFVEENILPHKHTNKLNTHYRFIINYNGKNIITAHVTTDKPIELVPNTPLKGVTFSYSVTWLETEKTVKDRIVFEAQSRGQFFPKSLEVHWLSVINSTVLVLLLIGFVFIILMRILRNDLARYNKDDVLSSPNAHSDEMDFDDAEVGWKMIHADVFRFPFAKSLLCAILGVGTQFIAIAGGLITMGAFDMFRVHKHGTMYSSAVVLYAFTCFLAGYVSVSHYVQMAGSKWVHNLMLVCVVFAGPMFLSWSVVNSFHWAYASTQALPFTTCLLIAFICLCIGVPLTVIGGVFGKNWAPLFDAPCRTKNIKREIPATNWYNSSLFQMIVGGFISFSSISVQLHYAFETIWGREQYFLYGIMLLSFFLLLLVSGAIGVALTYFQLSAEDYRWWWRSICNVGATGVFVFLYSIYYYWQKSSMSGVLQSVEYFTYTLLVAYIFFLTLGTVSFFASLKFIKHIYRNLKMD